MDNHNTALRVQDLSKSYATVKAVDGISFEVNHGEIFGMLGPNGAGKTSTIRMILDIIKPDSGQIQLKSGDLLVHTTDGLHEQVSIETLTFLLTSPDSIETKAKSLIQAALDAGGKDNITVTMTEI